MSDLDFDTTDDNKGRDGSHLLPKIVPAKDDYYMGLLITAASICRDPAGQEAAVVVDEKDRWVSFGVNFIEQPDQYGVNKSKFSWESEDRDIAMVTAVESAIDRALKMYTPGWSSSLGVFHSHILYTTGPLQLKDVRRCASNGLKEIVYGPLRSKFFDASDWAKAKKLADLYKMKLKKFDGNLNWLRDRAESLSYLF